MKISDILRHKGSAVVTIAPTGPVQEMLAKLAEHNVGALVVVDDGQVLGIVSERDVVRRINERGSAVLLSTVSEIMTTDVFTCSPQESVDSIAETMTQRRIRHVPIVDDGQLVGIVSIGDVVLSRIRQLEYDRGHLEHYISG